MKGLRALFVATAAQAVALPEDSCATSGQGSEVTSLLQHGTRRVAPQVKAELLQDERRLSATPSGSGKRPLMTDVKTAFENMANAKGFILEANIGKVKITSYNKGYPPYSNHFQSVQRAQDTNVLYVSASNGDTHQAELFIFEMGERPTQGAMGSNMWDQKRPPPEDALKSVIAVDKEYYHAGGMTSFDNILAIGAEPACEVAERVAGNCKVGRHVHFYDTTDPLNPRKLPYVVDGTSNTAGTTSLTQMDNGLFLLVIGGPDALELDFYISKTTTLMCNDPGFQKITTWNSKSLLVDAGQSTDYGGFQTLNFVRQKDGQLFMVGFLRTMKGMGSDRAELFRVDSEKGISIMKVGQIDLSCSSRTCNFMAGSGAYIASSETMLFYATDWEPNWKEKAIYFNEFRPANEGVGGECNRMTSGSCSFLGCASSRGPTVCLDGTCQCKEGYCHDGNGKCVAAR